MIISIIGAGSIGGAVARSLVKSRVAERIIASRRHVERIMNLKELGVLVTSDNRKAAEDADVIIICVKPKDVGSVIRETRDSIAGKLVISMAAAISLNFLEKMAPEAKFVRVMPNLAVLVQESFSAYSASRKLSEDERIIVEKVLGALGRFVEVPEEMMDIITALSGCAPGYLAFIVKALIDASVRTGLPEDIALKAAAQSMIGTGKLILEAGLSISEIIRMVATPGGVTEEILKRMERSGLAEKMGSALEAGVEKSNRIAESLNLIGSG